MTRDALLLQFVGFLSADVPELHTVEVPLLVESVNRFLAALTPAGETPARQHATPHAAQIRSVADWMAERFPTLSSSAVFAKELRAASDYVETIERENTALRNLTAKHCASCMDAQCWGVRVGIEAKLEQAEQQAQTLREEMNDVRIHARSMTATLAALEIERDELREERDRLRAHIECEARHAGHFVETTEVLLGPTR